MIITSIIFTNNYEQDCARLDKIFGKSRKTHTEAIYESEHTYITLYNMREYSLNNLRGKCADLLYIPEGTFVDQTLYNDILSRVTENGIVHSTEYYMKRLNDLFD